MILRSLLLTKGSPQFNHNKLNPVDNTTMPKIENNLKAERREVKKRPRMKVHGASLKRPSKFAGLKIVKKKS
ncbi:MAG: hypothetical protein A3I07_03430 [Candidatus Doudnabacteria bacterium RIFCSPLOWO2_02_FULL_42_9]|uniref:Uncharacterized protein n=1 Tax=Candidatus Doudnabacteria bacterium RIFCSPHIGHO2_01_FULL_41_86 TaxID=1817821 RepID=A0A1F5N8H5_9BACT|nr:MAG: hypothetical protein A2717_03830 [Candidatus Doudnabacteria bacterium RIFCSPHIGHO2_01_FULL_41_86]OGE85766.1 MAG: hypothetical protein A3E28_03160 [Candidatus Doudnabacteria bacterium RIFCSPHIGHO2_12_FULL_42_22]OGE87261.1 MAG: hypothetical protein A3C49_00785 [Candidatus Doudnabacteria bacterium RIFCSPHIGHO2_02_FULL_42_25]OGE92098.1 MAG: hypothetical protein A2895_00660 [Candidatus Doudnabacteria bacterium RIFCSPLOWO2_01_FULL_42_60]OGE99229.1 MAG: hypothetical protein A3G89_02775 [Candid